MLQRAGRLLVLSDVLWIAQAGLIASALASALSSLNVSNPQDVQLPVGFLMLMALLVGLVAIVRVLLQVAAQKKSRSAARHIKSRTRSELLNVAVSRSPALPFPSSGAFAVHIGEQVDLLGPYYQNYLPQETRLKLVPLAIVLVTLWFSWLAALILVVSGPMIPIFMALIGSRAKAASAERQEELTRLSGTLLDRIKGMETLRLFGAVDRTREDIRRAGDTFRVGTMRVLKIAFLSSTVLELFSALGIAFCAVYVGFSLLGEFQVGTWGAPLSYAQGLFVLLLAPEFFAPLRAFAVAYHDRAAGLAAQQKLTDLINETSATADCSQAPSSSEKRPDQSFLSPPRIRFVGVSVTHSDYPIFKDLNLEILSGEMLFLKGESGSGKTTLLDCILGFHQPAEGEVRIGDQRLSDVLVPLRENVMWLSQSPRLFHGSLKANLIKGIRNGSEVTDQELRAALRLAGAGELVERLPHGLATQLGEDGFGLSVGEIRRVALARAAMRKESVLLLADEPTAGLDPQTATDVINGLTVLSNGRTSLIATHDPLVLGLQGRQLDVAVLRCPAELAAT
ncbi:ATP-binding/permease protein CydD [Labrenzia sp. THAF82]|uniref:thiol reductant ABC exporter subunit CydD n=1 Tax=Labrenzia sp. THAF82 TaxID=2587861 RepID=UPI0012A8FFE7|nr:thiol reductant ABC exporter subunit CydD [Labrenzia sp. THAF82]QFT32597.1 ATP-binding/permease protein CydD [Labrenzia sp. THAF82]